MPCPYCHPDKTGKKRPLPTPEATKKTPTYKPAEVDLSGSIVHCLREVFSDLNDAVESLDAAKRLLRKVRCSVALDADFSCTDKTLFLYEEEISAKFEELCQLRRAMVGTVRDAVELKHERANDRQAQKTMKKVSR